MLAGDLSSPGMIVYSSVRGRGRGIEGLFAVLIRLAPPNHVPAVELVIVCKVHISAVL